MILRQIPEMSCERVSKIAAEKMADLSASWGPIALTKLSLIEYLQSKDNVAMLSTDLFPTCHLVPGLFAQMYLRILFRDRSMERICHAGVCSSYLYIGFLDLCPVAKREGIAAQWI